MDQVDEVKQKTDIVSVIGSYINLKKAGRNYKALCPFHTEKTPSFMVSPELQIYKCFGCLETGDVFSFLEKYEGMDFGEALRFLAEKAGVKLTADNFAGRGGKESIFEVNASALRFYSYILLNHPAGKKALNYLTRERGLKLDTIKKFQLGYSPKVSRPIVNYLTKKKNFKQDLLVGSGIFYPKGASLVDRFEDRVVFPIFDHRGNALGFTGRVLPGDKREVGKYVNTPETAAYHKSNVLYGLNFSKEEIKRKKEAVVVEGQMDLISLFQAGFRNSVAVSGTALTKEQVDLLSRFSQKIILSLDADSAGDLAARRGIVIAQEAGMDISVAMLGEYKDPDEMVRKSPQAFARAVESAVGVWDFYINSSFSKFNSTTGEGKQKISREIVPILASIPDKIVQSHYVNLVAEKLSAPASAVFDEIEKIESKGVFSQKKEELPKKEEKSRRQLLQERFLAIAFQIFPEMIIREESKKYLSFHILVRIVDEYLAFVKDGSRFDATAFLNRLPEELRAKFSELMLENLEDLLSDEAKAKKELEVVERELEILKFKEEIVNLKGKIAELEKAGNKEKLKEAEQEFTSLSRALVELEGKEGAGIY